MKTKIALMTAVMAFSYFSAQERPYLEDYSKKIDSIVVSEKSKMNAELDEVDKDFKAKKISAEEKQRKRIEIASKYEVNINEKVSLQQSVLENTTKEIVKNAVLGQKDSLYEANNRLYIGIGGLKMKFNKKEPKSPKQLLRTLNFNVSFMGANLTSKNEAFRFYSRDSDVRRTVYNAYSFSLRYENQLGGYKSPLFYRFGVGVRSDEYVPKYGKVFTQEDNVLTVGEFTKGNLKTSKFNNTYIFVPIDLRWVLNPKYVDFNGEKYLDAKKRQVSLVAGIYGGVRVGTIIYNKYSTEFSKRIVERETVRTGMNDFVFGAKFGIGFGGLNLFIQKDLTPAFNDNAQLKKKYGLQIGIELANIYF